jgi:hypothetical protein
MAYLEVKKELDGRKQRTNSSRQKIVEAMLVSVNNKVINLTIKLLT